MTLSAMASAERIFGFLDTMPEITDKENVRPMPAIRGDVDWVQYPISTLKKSIVDSQDLIPICVYSKKRLKILPDVPTVVELGYPDLVDVVKMYRPVAGPPELPQDVAELWRDVFWKATNDPEFQQKQIAANATPLPMNSKELEEMVQGAIKLITQYKDLILKYRK